MAYDNDVEADVEIELHETWFERRHDTHRRTELEVEMSYDVEGGSLAELILLTDQRAAELAEGRQWYVYNLRVQEQEDGSLVGSACAYISVPRALGEQGRATT